MGTNMDIRTPSGELYWSRINRDGTVREGWNRSQHEYTVQYCKRSTILVDVAIYGACRLISPL